MQKNLHKKEEEKSSVMTDRSRHFQLSPADDTVQQTGFFSLPTLGAVLINTKISEKNLISQKLTGDVFGTSPAEDRLANLALLQLGHARPVLQPGRQLRQPPKHLPKEAAALSGHPGQG